MSLINRMLRDLDARTGGMGPARPAYEGLTPVTGVRPSRTRNWWIGLAVTGAAAGVFAAVYWIDLPPVSIAHTESNPPVATKTPPAQSPAKKPDGGPRAAQRVDPEATAPQPVQQASAAPVALPAEAKPAPPAAPVARRTVASAPGRRVTEKKPHRSGATEKRNAAVEAGAIHKTVRPMTEEELAAGAYQKGTRHLKHGQAVPAGQAFRAALKHDPRHVRAREALAGVLLQLGQWREVQALLQEGMKLVPEHYRFAQILGRLQAERGEVSQAIAVMEQQRRYGQSDPEYMALLGAVYQRAKRHQEAVGAYRAAVARHPYEGRWWLGLAISLEAQRDVAGARAAYRRATDVGLNAKLRRYAQQRLAALE